MDKRKRIKKLFSILLACVMVLNLPMSVLATEEFQTSETLSETVLIEEQTAENNDVSEGEISDLTDEEDPVEEILEDEVITDEMIIDSSSESSEIIEEEEQFIISEEADELEQLNDGEISGTTPANPVQVSVTISNQGNLVMMKQTITVSDYDNDGNLDVDDALYAAHKIAYTGGAAEGYACEETSYGLSLAKLWGDTSGSFGYWLNDSSCMNLSVSVSENDNLVAFVYQDKTEWSDSYSKFSQAEYTATAGEAFEVSVEKAGYDESGNVTFSTFDGAILKAYDSGKTELPSSDYTVTGNTVTFENAGTYYLTAMGNTDTILVPAVTIVTVNPTSGNELRGSGTENDPYIIQSADQLPAEITAGTYYVLGADITLGKEQQIQTIEGTFDGKGHVVTLSGTAFAGTVSGTIQNLGVAGSVSGGTGTGSVAMTLTGTIRNSFSTASVAASGFMDDVGGFAGNVNGGMIKNCYYAGSVTVTLIPAFVGIISNAVLKNCYYTTSSLYSRGKIDSDKRINCEQKTGSEFAQDTITELLNDDIENTGYHFASLGDGSYPYLSDGVIQINWKGLEKAIADAKEKETEKDIYTAETWDNLAKALENAENLYDSQSETATQKEINEVVKTLNEAIAALKKKPVITPVSSSGKNIITVNTQNDLDNSKFGTADNYFMLANDITIDSSYNWLNAYTKFNGILDGQGHTITFSGSDPLFYSLGEGAIVQNVKFKGSVNSTVGPLGSLISGTVVNCYSEVSGNSVCGFAGVLASSGVISNCISTGEAKKGAFVASNEGGTVLNAFYCMDYASSVIGTGMSEGEMKTLDFVRQLNHNRGEYGTKWGQGSDGYPYFGENQEYTPEDPDAYPDPAGESLYQAEFKAHNSEQSQKLENNQLQVSPQLVDSSHICGTLSLSNYQAPENTKLAWNFTYAKPEKNFARDEDTGELYVYGTGKAVLTATEVNTETYETKTLAYVSVLSVSAEMQDIRLYIDGTDVTNKSYPISGSEQKWIKVKAKVNGSEDFEEVGYTNFIYEVNNPEKVFLRSNASNSFYFKEPGEATITVTSKQNPDLKATILLSSEYVPVISVKPALSQDVYTIHGRNANSEGQEEDGRIAYNPIHDNVIVIPSNATNADHVTVTSSDETVGYYRSGEKVYVPKEAGTVTYTASVNDTDPVTGEEHTVTGSKTISFRYLNPVSAVTSGESSETVTVAAGESRVLSVTVTGSRDEEGYHVTEPALNWTYDKPGIVVINSQAKGYFDREEASPDYNQYFPEMTYTILGLSEGTVTATGTPVDQTNNVTPVKVTITVEGGDVENKDIDGITAEISGRGHEYITDKHSEKGYVYGNEWLIFAQLRAGKTIDQKVLDAYYDSVVNEISTWKEDRKATDWERVALALTAMGKDITNINGINLAERIYNHPDLAAGSNETIYALISLDAADISIPSNAKWSRNSMIAELLKFQNPVNGGFGLTDNQTVSVDMTAMALQALANYKNRAEVKTSVEKALGFLKKQQNEDFGYGNAESTAQVLIALSLLGIDPASAEEGFGTPDFNLITNLQYYQKDDGGFSHLTTGTASLEMSTVQVLHALDAYQKSKASDSYWNVNGQKAEVTFTLLGDSNHGENGQEVHTLAKGNLETWIPETVYRVKEGSTVKDLIEQALKASGMTCVNNGGNYISSITKNGVTLAEFINGKRSGWMYTLNGEYPDLGIAEQTLQDNDRIVFHYTDDYTKEKNREEVPEPEPKPETRPQHVHSYGGWKKITDATVFAPESQERICSGCGNKETRNVGKVLTPTMKVNATKIPLKVKQKTGAFKVTGLAKGDSILSWKSSNTKVFTVSKSGVITAGKKKGKATLTITLASGLKKKVTVSVQKGTVKTSKITGLKSKVTLKKGEKLTLKPSRTPITSTQKFTYSSSKKKIAAVNSRGVITAKKAGKAKITVKSGNKKFVVTVTVTK